MWTAVGLMAGFIFLIIFSIKLAKDYGSSKTNEKALKQEVSKRAEEQARANKIIYHVSNMPADECRKWMQNNRCD